jgi:hypothetical protein
LKPSVKSVNNVSLPRSHFLMSVLAPTGEMLFFACPKKSIQKKRHPDAACFLRSSLLVGVAERGFLPLRQRGASMRRPYRAFPTKSSGARRGIRGENHPPTKLSMLKNQNT